MNIYVGNIAYNMSDDELRVVFENFGDVDSARIITDRDTGRSKGFGFVEMPDSDQAAAALEALNGSEIMGRTLTVNEARPKKPRNEYGGGGGRRGGGYNGGGDGGGYDRY
ncbi:RNA recognition motif domain-containing protein [Desulfoluna spongiiphila]|uniref:RNA recognition motif. (A.k.a. RRM, RBD, or RNP domain) n=1 Tax=Desulfoluna spongiiphila TaxID=419481 RepID=A0A1G5B1W1_9BACT|nr:RNA-binding protein [Desulfoluna spongiiphila]SCX84050.1 RNA recognition motif. (a.k.a. RRM, RBD, or RNP domain) [Desulfoluna spongiiphila]VVS92133.1 consensus disorder prediction [Desulfoluna spongiiphila]